MDETGFSLLVSSETNAASRARLLELAKSFDSVALTNLVFAVAKAASSGILSAAFAASLCHGFNEVLPGSKGVSTVNLNAQIYVGGHDVNDPLLVSGLVCDALFLLDAQLQPDEIITDPNLQKKRANLVAFAKHIKSLAFIPTALFLERLDTEFLDQVALLPVDVKFWQRKVVRINTSMLYKQQKFNLLREESEGFSMLETFLAGNLPPSLDVFWASRSDSSRLGHDAVYGLWKDHVSRKVETVLENITSLIGYFDLNPNKVLDVILDVFIANVVDHWDFFVELLNKSAWQPTRTSKTIVKANGEDSVSETVEGSYVLGQVLGFKYDYYNHVATTNVTPPQLLWITAVLIKHRLIQLEDIYPHLSPADEDMDKELKAFKDKLDQQKKAGGKYKDTSLADAGALGDDGGGGSGYSMIKERGGNNDRTTVSQPTTDSVAPSAPLPPKPRKTNQKAVLASYLLALGSINHARQILDRNPVLVKVHQDVSDYMSRLLDRIIEPVYQTIRPIRSRVRQTVLPASQPPPMNTLNCKMAQSSIQLGRKINYPKLKFFYDKWDEGLPPCNSFDDVIKVLRLLLPYIAVSLDVVFVTKVARLGRAHIASAPEDEKVKNNWLSILAKFLLPALSMTDQNPGLAHDIWMVVKQYPYDRRYALYGEWKHKTYAAIPQLAVAKAGCISDAKYTMRRLSKDTVKRFGRYIGKIGHSNPTIAFHYILDLLQTYENQNVTVVEGSRYMSELSFDVVTFTLVEQLSVSKERVQAGGIGVKTWLKSLSFFTGSIFKKHSIELSGILRYLFSQLVQGNTFDLIILQELVQQMCGIKAITDDVTADQFNALAAGDVLRREAFGNEPLRVVKKVSNRLLKALLDTELAIPFAVLMGQRIEGCVFSDVGEIKILGWGLDSIRSTFTQYMDFIVSHSEREMYSSLVADIDVLRNNYNLTPDVAFAILRPKLQHITRNEVIKPPPSLMSSDMDIDSPPSINIHPNLLPVLQSVQKTLPESTWKILSPQFYITFWSLTLYDIDFPKAKYQSEIEKLKNTISSLTLDKSNAGTNTPAKRRKDIEKHRVTIGLVEKEMAAHEIHVRKVLDRLKVECLGWFASKDAADLSQLVILIMQHCVVPRSLFSPADALFGAKFMFLAQEMGVPNLMTLPFFDRILSKNNLQSMIYLCTEMEARNFGRFMQQILQTLTSWFQSPKLYTQLCLSPTHPGFALRWNPDPTTGKIPAEDLMSIPDFRKVMLKWHASMHKTITLCLESGDFSQITNGILILMKIQDYFPMIREHAQTLEKSCNDVIAKETERKDLKLMCTAYAGRLQKMSKTLMSRLAFSNGGVEPPGSNSGGSGVDGDAGRSSGGGRLNSSLSSDRLDTRNDGPDRRGEVRDNRGNDRDRDRDGRMSDNRDSRDRDQRERNRVPDRPKDGARIEERRNDNRSDDRLNTKSEDKRIDSRDSGRRDDGRRNDGARDGDARRNDESRRNEPAARDSPRKPAASNNSVSTSSPARTRDDDRGKREDSRGDTKRFEDPKAERGGKVDEKEPAVKEREAAPRADLVPSSSAKADTPLSVPLPAKPQQPEDPLSKLREKVAKTMHPHPVPAEAKPSAPVAGPERPPSQPPIQPPMERLTATPEQKPKLSISERLGGRVDSSAATANPPPPENSSSGTEKRTDKKTDRGDRRDRDRDRDRGDRSERGERSERSDRDRDRDRGEKKDRKKSSRGDRDERDDKPSKRDRSGEVSVATTERETKRVKVDESDIPKSSETKKDPIEVPSKQTSNIPEPPPPPPPNAIGESLEAERHKRVKLDRNFDRNRQTSTNSSGNQTVAETETKAPEGNATEVRGILGRGNDAVIVERQQNNNDGSSNKNNGNRDRYNNDRNNSGNGNQYNRNRNYGGGNSGGSGGGRDRNDRNGGGYRR